MLLAKHPQQVSTSMSMLLRVQKTCLGSQHLFKRYSSKVKSLQAKSPKWLSMLGQGNQDLRPVTLETCKVEEGFDAIIVLGGGQQYLPDGSIAVYSWASRRLDLGASLLSHQSNNCKILCSGGGTPHRQTFLSKEGFVKHEATTCAEYLMDYWKVPPHRILKEIASFDTVGNAYFSLFSHAIPAGWRNLAIVTSDFHLPRSRQLFLDMSRLTGESLFGSQNWFSLHFYGASDDGLFNESVQLARVEKEAAALERWKSDAQLLPDAASLHTWLHRTHLCYAVERQELFGSDTKLDPRLKASY
uniref:DUF218 domain-containing protein n=1 Tax=Polytomella parva TaxID=51329 RepID=A0A7S0Y9M5_9CHLO|mmetsp:Transcript_11276/g.20404  ORF Transcript_11276/g.20404 Transcript_11276/m.20404 type:complete len:301 (+) Transcript_11276:77-979(+)